ncbi:hypothetical protein Gmet_3584 [Geobacter metallireducens GS-15]|uniref:Uncharacterized protein n=1 Tax=Geobacter metallireducens (strain ATCC 53774 / DSM 7210 / GS-15) TaxID=269799 RepID=J7LYC8_GEOMG|nr:hypothetical protein Gmet_3584 [Geobacter metallireducens GS-15]
MNSNQCDTIIEESALGLKFQHNTTHTNSLSIYLLSRRRGTPASISRQSRWTADRSTMLHAQSNQGSATKTAPRLNADGAALRRERWSPPWNHYTNHCKN